MVDLRKKFGSGKKLLLGVVHLRPLAGSPRNVDSLEAIVEAARIDSEALLDAGFDGYVVENFGDAPFYAGRVPPHVLTCMTRIVCELPRENAFVAVNVLRNDVAGALSVAAATGIQAIRVNVHCGAMVTDQGLIEGQAAETIRLRETIAPQVAVLADVDVKHAGPVSVRYSLADAARETAYRGLADALIVTGRATGEEAAGDDLRTVREAVRDRPVLVGSGVTRDSVARWLQDADGVIVGSSLKHRGQVEQPVDIQVAKSFVKAARG